MSEKTTTFPSVVVWLFKDDILTSRAGEGANDFVIRTPRDVWVRLTAEAARELVDDLTWLFENPEEGRAEEDE